MSAFWFNLALSQAWIIAYWLKPGLLPTVGAASSMLLAALILWAFKRAALGEP